MCHQVHDEGLEDPIEKVCELDTGEFAGPEKVMDATFVSSEDGISAVVAIAGNFSAAGG